jgi:hypothetical protein
MAQGNIIQSSTDCDAPYREGHWYKIIGAIGEPVNITFRNKNCASEILLKVYSTSDCGKIAGPDPETGSTTSYFRYEAWISGDGEVTLGTYGWGYPDFATTDGKVLMINKMPSGGILVVVNSDCDNLYCPYCIRISPKGIAAPGCVFLTADAGPDKQVEEDSLVSFDASGSAGDIVSYYWDFDDRIDSDGDTIYDNDRDAADITVSHMYTTPGTYTVTLTVYDINGNWAKDTVKVAVTPSKKYNIRYLYVPVGTWSWQADFEWRARERAAFFIDISPLKDCTNVKNYYLDKDWVSVNCNVETLINCYTSDPTDISQFMQNLKECADLYASSIGIDYEKAIGLSDSFSGGCTYLGNKVSYSSLGFSPSYDRPAIVAHELAHNYYLCDEYNYAYWDAQNTFLASIGGCPNSWPSDCSTTETECPGNYPAYRNYGGPALTGQYCGKNLDWSCTRTDYSIMGWSIGCECGYDKTGGYSKIKEQVSC